MLSSQKQKKERARRSSVHGAVVNVGNREEKRRRNPKIKKGHRRNNN